MANQVYSSIHSGAEIDEQITYVKKDLRKKLERMDEAISKKPDSTDVVKTSERNQPNGFAGLDENGKVPSEILPPGSGGGSSIELDTEMSDTSENAVQNKIIKKYVDENVGSIESIAKDRATGYVFDTVDDMNAWLSDSNNVANLNLGDNLYIRATDVPDYWWDGTQAQELETQKVDLTEYVKNTDYANGTTAGVVRIYSNYGVSIVDGRLRVQPATKDDLGYIGDESAGAGVKERLSYSPIVGNTLHYAVEVCTNQDSEAELTEAQLRLPPSTQFLKSGYMPLSGGALTGAISFKDANAIASKSDEQPRFILVMESFANGGAVKYVTRDFLLGDVETALDNIIAIQNSLIGGGSV